MSHGDGDDTESLWHPPVRPPCTNWDQFGAPVAGGGEGTGSHQDAQGPSQVPVRGRSRTTRGSPYPPFLTAGAGKGTHLSPLLWSWQSLGGVPCAQPPLFAPQAVCCPDHVHCCPQGYTCDPEGGSCLQEGGTPRPWVRKTPALPRGGQVTSRNVICDEETSCPDGSTCCRMSLGTWGCCPLEQVWGALPVAMGVHTWVGWGTLGCTPGSRASWTKQRFQGVLGCPWRGGQGSMDPGWSICLGDVGTFSRAQPLPVPPTAPWTGGLLCPEGTKDNVSFSPGGSRPNVPLYCLKDEGRCPLSSRMDRAGSKPPMSPWDTGPFAAPQPQ